MNAPERMNAPGPATGRTTKGDNTMRKVTAAAAAAFCAGQSMNVQNATVTANADGGATAERDARLARMLTGVADWWRDNPDSPQSAITHLERACRAAAAELDGGASL